MVQKQQFGAAPPATQIPAALPVASVAQIAMKAAPPNPLALAAAGGAFFASFIFAIIGWAMNDGKIKQMKQKNEWGGDTTYPLWPGITAAVLMTLGYVGLVVAKPAYKSLIVSPSGLTSLMMGILFVNQNAIPLRRNIRKGKPTQFDGTVRVTVLIGGALLWLISILGIVKGKKRV